MSGHWRRGYLKEDPTALSGLIIQFWREWRIRQATMETQTSDILSFKEMMRGHYKALSSIRNYTHGVTRDWSTVDGLLQYVFLLRYLAAMAPAPSSCIF